MKEELIEKPQDLELSKVFTMKGSRDTGCFNLVSTLHALGVFNKSLSSTPM